MTPRLAFDAPDKLSGHAETTCLGQPDRQHPPFRGCLSESGKTPRRGQPAVRRTLPALLEALGAVLPPEAVLVLPYGRGTSPRQREAAVLAHQAAHAAHAIVMVGRPDTRAYHLAYPPGAVCGWVAGRLRFPGHASGAPFPTVVCFRGPDPRPFLRAFAPWGDCYRHVTRSDLTRKDTTHASL